MILPCVILASVLSTGVEIPDEGVQWVWDEPFSHNRLVSRKVLDSPASVGYSLHAVSGRDAVLMWRTDKEGESFSWHPAVPRKIGGHGTGADTDARSDT